MESEDASSHHHILHALKQAQGFLGETTMQVPMQIVYVSAVAGGLFIVLPLITCCAAGENKGTIIVSIMLAIVCCYLFWLIVFLSQLNPLIGPMMENHTIAWISEVWGDPA